ncbi:hypothetical protein [Paenibacillus sp. YYML68]|uniref:hypothetical protein n=1 Tax=Paenibacillus sp. YYML68 TaxID=2909250 RepID=UPI002491E67D|nr:hypothetical protein [Paenibacillus sp. YYML68]
MTKKKSDSKKSVAKVLTATMAASTIVTVVSAASLGTDFLQDAGQTETTVTDSVYEEKAEPTVTESVYEVQVEQPPVTPPVVAPPVVVAPVQAPVAGVEAALQLLSQAADASSMKAVLGAPELALNLSLLEELAAEDQTAVAAELVKLNIAGQFGSTLELQTALDAAVAAQRDVAALRNAIAAVSQAADAASMKEALESPYLGLVMVGYRTMTDEAKLQVADAVKNAVPSEGFTDRGAVQTAFKKAVVAVIQLQAAN